MVLERNPEFPRRALSVRRRAGRRGGGPAGRRRQAAAVHRPGRVHACEKESIPYWNKFLQGYYDASGISSDTFDQAVRVTVAGRGAADARDAKRRASACRPRSPRASIYMGFNMLDPVVGGRRASARASCARRSPSPSTRRSSSPSSPTAAASRRRGRSRRASSATARARPGINPCVYDWVDGAAAAQADRAARRSCWPRPAIPTAATRKTGTAAGALPRHHRRAARATRRASTGIASSSPRSTCSS